MLHLGGEGGGKEEGERERGRWGGEAGGRKRERGKEGRQEEEEEGGREIGRKAGGRVGVGITRRIGIIKYNFLHDNNYCPMSSHLCTTAIIESTKTEDPILFKAYKFTTIAQLLLTKPCAVTSDVRVVTSLISRGQGKRGACKSTDLRKLLQGEVTKERSI